MDKISEWIDWLRITFAASTVEAYEWEMLALERWADQDVLELSRADLARYLAERRILHQCGDASIKRSVNAFKSFYRFALGKRSPARDLQQPGTKKRKQRTLNFDQALAVMLVCDTSRPQGKRDLAIICLGLDAGLREAELCRLQVSQVDLHLRRLTVRVKGGDDGDGIFGLDTLAALASWLSVRSIYAAPGVGAMFVSIGGNKPGQMLTPSGLRVVFRRIGAAAGLEHFSPHDLRRSFATMSHKLGAPTRIVQVAGRWSDVRMVERYTQALEPADIDPYSPVSHILRLNLKQSD